MSEDKTLQKCNFCYSCDELNTEEIPFWSKKSGNYSPYPKMVTCEEQYNLSIENRRLCLAYLGNRIISWQGKKTFNIYNTFFFRCIYII